MSSFPIPNAEIRIDGVRYATLPIADLVTEARKIPIVQYKGPIRIRRSLPGYFSVHYEDQNIEMNLFRCNFAMPGMIESHGVQAPPRTAARRRGEFIFGNFIRKHSNPILL